MGVVPRKLCPGIGPQQGFSEGSHLETSPGQGTIGGVHWKGSLEWAHRAYPGGYPVEGSTGRFPPSGSRWRGPLESFSGVGNPERVHGGIPCGVPRLGTVDGSPGGILWRVAAGGIPSMGSPGGGRLCGAPGGGSMFGVSRRGSPGGNCADGVP
jgi:hypothetical protein